MRQALTGLTTRGRCFVAAGFSTALSAVVLGEDDLLRVAVFLAALPLIAAFLVARTQFRLSCQRVISPARVPAGEPATVRLTLDNISRVPTGLLLLEDTLPYTLGGRPRFVVDRVPAGDSRTVHYEAGGELRGRYRIGPLRLRLTDPFGLVELTRGFSSTDFLTVVPTVHPLPTLGLGGAWSTGGDSSSRSVAVQGDDDAATREYRDGDDLRKVHWRSTARIGKLMVRREEQPWQTRAAILLDARLSRHRGEGTGSSFEWSVSAAASIGVHLGRLGYSLRLFSDSGELHTGTDGDFSAGHQLLDQLAIFASSSSLEMDRGVQALRQANEDGLLVAILGDIGPDEAQALATGRAGTARSIGVLCDVSSWMGGSAADRGAVFARHEASVSVLRRCGWRVVVGRRGRTITEAWAQVGVSAYAASGNMSFGVEPAAVS
ncbi:MAG: DUF58 domain-containing protein [Geodermatophilaceae bacterium]|nr:DUF58 domain-containing protein [Geodermatophilaceae bacterium]